MATNTPNDSSITTNFAIPTGASRAGEPSNAKTMDSVYRLLLLLLSLAKVPFLAFSPLLLTTAIELSPLPLSSVRPRSLIEEGVDDGNLLAFVSGGLLCLGSYFIPAVAHANYIAWSASRGSHHHHHQHSMGSVCFIVSCLWLLGFVLLYSECLEDEEFALVATWVPALCLCSVHAWVLLQEIHSRPIPATKLPTPPPPRASATKFDIDGFPVNDEGRPVWIDQNTCFSCNGTWLSGHDRSICDWYSVNPDLPDGFWLESAAYAYRRIPGTQAYKNTAPSERYGW